MLSVCMIVRDEAHQVGGILSDLVSFADEVVVVDTGSKDGTKDAVINAYPSARMFDFPWCDDFSAARNFSIDQAKGDHIMILDADDRVDAENATKIRGLKSKLNGHDVLRFNIINTGWEHWKDFTQIRLFPNRTDLRYRGKAHNELDSAVEKAGLRMVDLPITIRHEGYANEEVQEAKQERTIAILEKEYAENPDSERVNSYLGSLLAARGDFQKALPHLEKALEVMDRNNGDEGVWGRYVCYPALMRCLCALGDRVKAVAYASRFIATLQGTSHMNEFTELIEDLDLWEEINPCACA